MKQNGKNASSKEWHNINMKCVSLFNSHDFQSSDSNYFVYFWKYINASKKNWKFMRNDDTQKIWTFQFYKVRDTHFKEIVLEIEKKCALCDWNRQPREKVVN